MTAVRVWAGLVVVYGLGVAFAFTGDARPAHAVLGFSIVVCAGVLGVTQSRVVAGLTAAVALLAYLGPVPATITAHVIWVSAAVALFTGPTLGLVLRFQAGTVYIFAGLNKLWPPFLSGDILDRDVSLIPGWPILATAVVAYEIGLGVLILLRSRWAVHAVVALHLPMAFLAATRPLLFVTLVMYAGMMVWCVANERVWESGRHGRSSEAKLTGQRPSMG